MSESGGTTIDLAGQRLSKAKQPKVNWYIVGRVIGQGATYGMLLGTVYGAVISILLLVFPRLFHPAFESQYDLESLVVVSLGGCAFGLFFGLFFGAAGGLLLGIPQGLMLALLNAFATGHSLGPKTHRALAAISSIAVTTAAIYLLSELLRAPTIYGWLFSLGIPGIIAAIAFVRISLTTIAWAEGERQLTQ
jgi:hypothetical protein